MPSGGQWLGALEGGGGGAPSKKAENFSKNFFLRISKNFQTSRPPLLRLTGRSEACGPVVPAAAGGGCGEPRPTRPVPGGSWALTWAPGPARLVALPHGGRGGGLRRMGGGWGMGWLSRCSGVQRTAPGASTPCGPPQASCAVISGTVKCGRRRHEPTCHRTEVSAARDVAWSWVRAVFAVVEAARAHGALLWTLRRPRVHFVGRARAVGDGTARRMAFMSRGSAPSFKGHLGLFVAEPGAALSHTTDAIPPTAVPHDWCGTPDQARACPVALLPSLQPASWVFCSRAGEVRGGRNLEWQKLAQQKCAKFCHGIWALLAGALSWCPTRSIQKPPAK